MSYDTFHIIIVIIYKYNIHDVNIKHCYLIRRNVYENCSSYVFTVFTSHTKGYIKNNFRQKQYTTRFPIKLL